MFCGNHKPGLSSGDCNENLIERCKWLSTMRFGKPHATAYYTVEQLQAMGFVGLYRKEKHGRSLSW